MKENQKIIDYKWKRDVLLENENIVVATFYQILIVQEIEGSGFFSHRKHDLKQQKNILHDMLNEIFETEDMDYQNGIIYEVLLSGNGNCLSGVETECRICNSFFEKSSVTKYAWDAYRLHISILFELAREDMEKATLYAENLMTILKIRYGIGSLQYAKMKLHIIGEFYYHFERKSFCKEFENDYDYFLRHTAEWDRFFCDVILLYASHLVENGLDNQELWADRGEKEIERWRGEDFYGYFKCKGVWIRAKMLKQTNQHKEALKLLQETITDYIEKNRDDKVSFYGPIYLLAADICRENHEYHRMLQYAQQGLAICEGMGQSYSEWYYNLYNYVGIWHMLQHNWGEAEKLYGNNLKAIEGRFGKENENYIMYLNNLAYITMRQGRDALPFYEEFERIRSKKFSPNSMPVIYTMLNAFILSGAQINKIETIYKLYTENIVREEDRLQLDTIYMAAKARAGKFDEEFHSIIQKLQNRYQNNFTEELAIVYWNAILTWKWRNGCFDVALEISNNLMRQIGNKKEKGYIPIVVNHIQMLVRNEQYKPAEEKILFMLEWLYECILDTGCGDVSKYLLIMRIVLSIYIHSLKRGGKCMQIDQETGKLLLEKIICCKTIEREMRGFLGKYDKNEELELRRFKELHRKLAAMEIMEKGGPDAKEYMEEEQFREKKIRCLSEQAEYEASVNQEIMFHDKVRQYRLEEMDIPCASVCAEYFAYYRFYPDAPMLEKDEQMEGEICNFLVFVLNEEGGKVRIKDIIDIPLEMTWENELDVLDKETEFSENCEDGNGEIVGVIQCLRQLFAEPVLKYFDKEKWIYLGLDAMLQYWPMDLLFCDSEGEPLKVIMVESVRYAGEDTRIQFEGADALIIGNPQISFLDKKKERMPCGELESMEIARMLGTKAYVGDEARQKLLWGKESKTLIHINAHGGLLEENEDRIFQSNLFTDSFLKLAGYVDWKERCKLRDYGNGVLSGDDFLFMDLSKTELIVLSACVSGVGHMKGLQAVHGMRWAISAAGAENSITTLWEISDVAGGLLMVMFYRNLRSMSVSEALYYAKKCLRTITVEELRKDSVLWNMVEIGEQGRQKRYGEKDRPYSHWRNWAAFVHYHR